MSAYEFHSDSTPAEMVVVAVPAPRTERFDITNAERPEGEADSCRGKAGVTDARSPWPRAVVPGSTPALLLITIRPRRGNRPPECEWKLPAGCVLAVRCRSR